MKKYSHEIHKDFFSSVYSHILGKEALGSFKIPLYLLMAISRIEID